MPIVHRRAVCGGKPGDADGASPNRCATAARPCFAAGCLKPRTSPYSFQGLGLEALQWMRDTGDELGMPICVEVMDTRQVEAMEPLVDCFQIGARNMQNFDLLREVGKTRKAVLLKRGLAATVKDWLLSAEYVLSQGNRSVILCERGIKTFEDSIRYSLDLTSLPVARQLSHLPIIVDPSHAAGKRDYVSPPWPRPGWRRVPMAIIVEVHYNPSEAQCDGPQALLPEDVRRVRWGNCVRSRGSSEKSLQLRRSWRRCEH